MQEGRADFELIDKKDSLLVIMSEEFYLVKFDFGNEQYLMKFNEAQALAKWILGK